jgi:5-oxoprolinase (ATP-hydrolysing) subunit A
VLANGGPANEVPADRVWDDAEARTVDLNADVGEGSDDRPLLDAVTTVHVACGFHAGDPAVMRRTVAAAAAAGVAVGAHPSYPDREGFGRRPMDRSPAEVTDDVVYQLGALDGLARAVGATVRSVKPHGALYNRMAVDEPCARAIAAAVAGYRSELVLVVPAGSTALAVARDEGVPVVAEAFCDRGYRADGSLAPRGEPGSLVVDPDEAARRAVALAVDGCVIAVDGTELRLDCDTLCVHGDTPGATAIAAAVRRALGEAGVTVVAFAR